MSPQATPAQRYSFTDITHSYCQAAASRGPEIMAGIYLPSGERLDKGDFCPRPPCLLIYQIGRSVFIRKIALGVPLVRKIANLAAPDPGGPPCRAQPREERPMYIGLGTIVVILIIVVLVLMLRRR